MAHNGQVESYNLCVYQQRRTADNPTGFVGERHYRTLDEAKRAAKRFAAASDFENADVYSVSPAAYKRPEFVGSFNHSMAPEEGVFESREMCADGRVRRAWRTYVGVYSLLKTGLGLFDGDSLTEPVRKYGDAAAKLVAAV